MLFARAITVALLGAAAAAAASPAQQPGSPHSLRADRIDPELAVSGAQSSFVMGVSLQPILSWQLHNNAHERDQKQQSFELRISLRLPGGGTQLAWESGRTYSAVHEAQVPIPLRHQTEYEWQVRVWHEKRVSAHGNSLYELGSLEEPQASDWSEMHAFETLVSKSSWDNANATWIGGGNMLRGDFEVPAAKKIASARAYLVVGLDVLFRGSRYVNGDRIGDHIMDPGQTVVTERVLYVSFDIADALKPGTNSLGGLLGNYKYGYLDIWCNATAAGDTFGLPGGACQTLKLMVVVKFTDGTSTSTGSNLDWKARNGPITYDHLWHGEIYDANREIEDWASVPVTELQNQLTVDGSDPEWMPAVAMHPLVGTLSPQLMPPIRIVQSFEPVSINTVEQGSFEKGCANGFDGGRFIRCPNCTGPAGKGVGGTLQDAVFYQSCSNELTHLTESEAYPSPCGFGHVAIELVEPAVLTGWESRFKGVVVCNTIPRNNTETLTVVDFGQNMAGFTTLKLTGTKGMTITLQHTENIGAVQPGVPHNTYYPGDGATMTKNGGKGGHGKDPSGAHVATTCGMTDSRSGGAPGSGWYERGWFECANQTDAYTFKGSELETFTPSFTYHGFRYVAVRGLPAGFKFTKEMLTAHFCHSDLPRVASLELPEVAATTDLATPNILNEIFHSTLCAQMSQLWSIPTDCPQREKRGWMGDAHMSSSGLMFSMDAQSFHTNFLQNINDDQVKGCQHNPSDPFIQPCTGSAIAQAAGAVPDVSPFQTSPYGSNPGSVVWQSAYPVIARNMWRHYGDGAVIKSHWASLKAFMDYLERVADPQTKLVLTGGLSDWVPPGGNGHGPVTDARECSAFYALLDTKHMAEMATAIGESEDASKYSAMYTAGAKAYHEHFWNATTMKYGAGSQCSCMMALWIGAVPPQLESVVLKTMVDDIESTGKYGPNHLDTGIIGTTFMFDTLTRYGRADVAIATLLNDSYPSFGHMIANGATTLWEAWEGSPTQQASSWNHIMFGGNIHTWVYSTLAGIDTAVNGSSAGWEHIICRPDPAAMLSLGHASASLKTRFGNASISWKLDAHELTIAWTVPPGSTAEVHVPQLSQLGGTAVAITEGGKFVWKAGKYVSGVPGMHAGSIKDKTEKPISDVDTVVLESGSGAFSLIAKKAS